MTVLYIDDDPDDRKIFQDALAVVDLSYRYIEAHDGKSALETLDSIIPDCIFLDVNMAETSGREVLLHIRSLNNLRHVPVVMFSTWMSRDDIVEFKSNGATHGIEKPWSFDELCSILRSVIHDLTTSSE
ncbi:MAG TPA: response regulator [Chryseolinea sp.]|nr:response regulator [Chryseolinea sp.]